MSSPALPRHRSAPARTSVVPHGHLSRPAPAPISPIRTSGGTGSPGRYRYNTANNSWWWSSEMFLVLGLEPGAAEPCVDLLLDAQHPDDRPRTRSALTAAGEHGRPFCVQARLHSPDECRRIVVVGEPESDGAGTVTAVSGLVALVTHTFPGEDERDALVAEIAQLRTAMASRAAIEQAKGIVMLLTGCGEQAAFNLLAHISSHTHRKVREVALAITESASGQKRLPADVQAILRDACPPGSPGH